jgi:hypothetical protein
MADASRPFSFGELLDGAFTLYRRNFAVLFGLALVPQLPLIVFWLIAPVVITGATTQALDAAGLLAMPYSLLAWMVSVGALVVAAAEAYEGGEPAIGASLKQGLRRVGPLLVATVVSYIAILFGLMLLLVPGLILLAMWFGTYPAIMLEGRGAFSALGRSRQLSRGARGRILGVLVVAWLITILPVIGLMIVAGISVGIGAVAGETVAGSGVWVLSITNAATSLVSAVTWPFLMAVTLLLYMDRVARTEAPDLEAAAASLQAELH